MFEKIYEAAINQDPFALQQALSIGCIDEHKKGQCNFSASAQLAYEKNIPAVEFLLKNGANLNYTGLGAAMGKHKHYAEELRHRGAVVHYLAWGASFANDKDYSLELINCHNANIDQAAQGAAVAGHLDFAEYLLQHGANITNIAEGAAIGGYSKFADELIRRGAEINAVAWGAGANSHKDYAENLIQRGANISSVAEGAAFSGQQSYAEELMQRGAKKDWIACGASKGGHRRFAEDLIKNYNLDLTNIAYGASFFGHRVFAENLLQRGAEMDAVVQGAKVYQFNDKKSLMAYLSFYQPETISMLMNDFSEYQKNRYDITLNRMIAISKQMHLKNLSYQEALVITDPLLQGMLYLLMLLSFSHNKLFMDKITLPWEIWRDIFNLVVPITLNEKAFETLALITGRSYLCAQLSSYQLGWFVKNRDRALSFSKAISQTNNIAEMQELIDKQTQVLQGNNPYSQPECDQEYKMNIKNNTVDKSHQIISFWNNLDKDNLVEFKNKQESRFLGCSIL